MEKGKKEQRKKIKGKRENKRGRKKKNNERIEKGKTCLLQQS